MSLEAEFTQALEGTLEAAKARGYIPTYLMQRKQKTCQMNISFAEPFLSIGT